MGKVRAKHLWRLNIKSDGKNPFEFLPKSFYCRD